MSNQLPSWFKQKLPDPRIMDHMTAHLEELSLHTICESAQCPNTGECFSRGTATFLILGNTCTRHCTFCAVRKGVPSPVDVEEPSHVKEAAAALVVHYVVVTSVTRDDLIDGGAGQFVRVVNNLHNSRIPVQVEVLVPDFNGADASLLALVSSQPEVINHNLETVRRLYPEVRPEADYDRSLRLLNEVKKLDTQVVTKSGLMVGLGEKPDEILNVMKDLRSVDCDLLTIGQYLQPSPHHHPVVQYIKPEQFKEFAGMAIDLGFKGVASAPLVRSSYNASSLYVTAKKHALILNI